MDTVKVVAAIILKENKVLATQRCRGVFEGKWEFPGGKVKAGESPEQALKRELMEELKASIAIKRWFCKREYDYPDFHLSMDCYLCTLESETISLVEHGDAQWLDPKQLKTLDWLPADVEIVQWLEEAFEKKEGAVYS